MLFVLLLSYVFLTYQYMYNNILNYKHLFWLNVVQIVMLVKSCLSVCCISVCQYVFVKCKHLICFNEAVKPMQTLCRMIKLVTLSLCVDFISVSEHIYKVTYLFLDYANIVVWLVMMAR